MPFNINKNNSLMIAIVLFFCSQSTQAASESFTEDDLKKKYESFKNLLLKDAENYAQKQIALPDGHVLTCRENQSATTIKQTTDDDVRFFIKISNDCFKTTIICGDEAKPMYKIDKNCELFNAYKTIIAEDALTKFKLLRMRHLRK